MQACPRLVSQAQVDLVLCVLSTPCQATSRGSALREDLRGPAKVCACVRVCTRAYACSGTRKNHTSSEPPALVLIKPTQGKKQNQDAQSALGCQINRYCIRYTFTNTLVLFLSNSH